MTEAELDLLADYAAGCLDGAEHAAVAARIADDPVWAHQYAALVAADSTVRAELAALPPSAMPPAVAARLHAVLDRESRRAGRTAPAAVPAAGSGAGDGPADRAARPGTPSGGTVVTLRRRRWWVASGAVAAGLVAIAAGLVAVQAPVDHPATGGLAQDHRDASSAEASGGASARATGTDYVPDRLPGQVRTLLAGPASTRSADVGLKGQRSQQPAPEADTDAVPAGLRRLTDPAALAACLDALGAGGTAPLAADLARYRGSPALVLVLPAADPSVVTVVVAGPACGVAGGDERHRATVPR